MPRLSTELLIIGGGATGLGIAWDACLRGFKVVLIEQNDIGQGTSGRYHGLLHSGARYAVTAPSLARECAQENAILRRIASAAIEDTGGYFLATPADPLYFPDRWLKACKQASLQVEEVEVAELLRREPRLSPRISRAFRVQDASMDSFDLLHMLRRAILEAGGHVLLRHRLVGFIHRGGTLVAAEIEDLMTASPLCISFELAINAGGPWAAHIANFAGVHLPLALGKGTMVAMASRPVHSVLNRCRPPSDGDIIVPVGSVSVLGTTDIPVSDPRDLQIQDHEVDALLAEAEMLLPGITHARALRAWAGIRPLLAPPVDAGAPKTRSLGRAHAILDHEALDGPGGIISVVGGKLTTFRLMAQECLDVVCERFGRSVQCSTSTTALEPADRRFFALPMRHRRLAHREPGNHASDLICECEFVQQGDIHRALAADPPQTLDDLRRDLRIGMGPCQAGFCALRTADIMAPVLSQPAQELAAFLHERWKGLRPVAWGKTLQQMEFIRRLYAELLGFSQPPSRSR